MKSIYRKNMSPARHNYNFQSKSMLSFPIRSFNIMSELFYPPPLRGYIESLYKLHNSDQSLLTDAMSWISDWKSTESSYAYYDYDDPDLMIEPLENYNHRLTWGFCFEMYLRRQLAILYASRTTCTEEKPGRWMLNARSIRLPIFDINSNDPDDIRYMDVPFSLSFNLQEIFRRNNTRYLEFDRLQLKWWYDGTQTTLTGNTSRPKFRCRPALFNMYDCMTFLHDNMELASVELITKVAYHLRPFRTVLPLTFLFDIFGGMWTNSEQTAIELLFPEKPNSTTTASFDVTVLADKIERKFNENQMEYNKFARDRIIQPRRANACVAGGFVSYLLGRTSEFSDIDIFIEYDRDVYEYIKDISEVVVSHPTGRYHDIIFKYKRGESVWKKVKQRSDIYDFSVRTCRRQCEARFNNTDYNLERKSGPYIFTWPTEKLTEGGQTQLINIKAVLNLNENLPIVQHWHKKYSGHLPQIIFYQTKLQMNEYNILKLISTFDLPICRAAIAFKRAHMYHLRERILQRLYGIAATEKMPMVKQFIDDWVYDENSNLRRKMRKIDKFISKDDAIKPKMRRERYKKKVLKMLENEDKEKEYIKKQRKMFLITWPYSFEPIHHNHVNFAKEKSNHRARHEKYLNRLVKPTTDFSGNKTLPLQVPPLKYLAYEKVMWNTEKSMNYNCLCNFDYCVYNNTGNGNSDNDDNESMNKKIKITKH